MLKFLKRNIFHNYPSLQPEVRPKTDPIRPRKAQSFTEKIFFSKLSQSKFLKNKKLHLTPSIPQRSHLNIKQFRLMFYLVPSKNGYIFWHKQFSQILQKDSTKSVNLPSNMCQISNSTSPWCSLRKPKSRRPLNHWKSCYKSISTS